MQIKVQSYSYNCKYNQIQNKNYNQLTNNQYQTRINNNPSFTGLSFKSIKHPFKQLFMADKGLISGISETIGPILRIKPEKIEQILTQSYASEKRVHFLDSLTEFYNARNWRVDNNLREDPQEVINIYHLITSPTRAHYSVIRSSNMPIKTLKEIFTHAQTPRSLEFVSYTQNYMLDRSNESAQIIIKMLKSKHIESFMENPNDYKSYLILHKKDPKCIEKLEKMIESGEYKPETFDIELMYENLRSTRHYQETLAPYDKFIHERINKPRIRFLRHFFENFVGFRKKLTKDDEKDLVKMCISSTEENTGLRIRIMNRFRDAYAEEETGISDIRSMRNLFETIDKDEYAATFVQKALNDDITTRTMEELRQILEIVPPKKASIFHKNIARIVEFTTPAERKTALVEELENPFFPEVKHGKTPYGIDGATIYSHQESFIERFVMMVRNKINIRKSKSIVKKVEPETPVTKTTSQPQRQKGNPTPVVNTPETNKKMTAGTSKTRVNPIITTPKSNKTTENNPQKTNIRRTLKSTPSAKKLQVQADVTDYVKTKLGFRAFEDQQRDYAIKATVMRLRLLPEIFDSIAATRKTQRANGIRPNVENRDAFLLYQMIQGRNRKLVRYMLKQTDSNGQRIFSIKDITKLIQDADSVIFKNKKSNPNYRAKDAKAYYEELYQNLIAQHGNLRRNSKK